MHRRFIFFFLCCWTHLLISIQSLEFGMIFMTKCVSEFIPTNSQVECDYLAYDKDDASKPIGLIVQLENPDGVSLDKKNSDTGTLTFKSTKEGEYKACFTVKNNAAASKTKLRIEWRIGAGEIDWDAVAKKEHFDEMDVSMKRLTTGVKDVSDELRELRLKEQEMREITEATNTRVTVYSIFCMITCVSLAVWQVWCLRRFFTKNKII